MRKYIGIVSGWNELKEITGLKCATRAEARRCDVFPGMVGGFRQVEQNAFHIVVRFENGSQKRTFAATDINDRLETREVECPNDRGDDGVVHSDHCIIETGAVKWLVGKKL